MSVLQVFVVFELVLRRPLLEDLAFQSSVCLLGITKVCNGKLIHYVKSRLERVHLQCVLSQHDSVLKCI